MERMPMCPRQRGSVPPLFFWGVAFSIYFGSLFVCNGATFVKSNLTVRFYSSAKPYCLIGSELNECFRLGDAVVWY